MALKEFGADLPFSVLDEGNLSNYDSALHSVKRVEIYKTQQQLDSAVIRYIDDMPALEVDFRTNQVVFITLGVQSNIGNLFTVDSIVDFDEYVSLDITYKTLGDGCLALASFTHPYKLLEISSSKFIVINEHFEKEDCLAQ